MAEVIFSNWSPREGKNVPMLEFPTDKKFKNGKPVPPKRISLAFAKKILESSDQINAIMTQVGSGSK